MAIPLLGQIIEGVYAKLSGDSTLTALLGTYSSATCIFDGYYVPSQAPRPYISLRPIASVSILETKQEEGLDVELNVEMFTDERESTIILEQIMDKVISGLHNQALTVDDTLILIKLIASVPVPTDENITGHRLTFRIVLF